MSKNIKTFSNEELSTFRSRLIDRVEKYRVALNKTHSANASKQYRDARKLLGQVNNEIHLRS